MAIIFERKKTRFKEDGFYTNMKKSKLHTATPYIPMHSLYIRSRALAGLKVPAEWNNGSLGCEPGNQTFAGIPASKTSFILMEEYEKENSGSLLDVTSISGGNNPGFINSLGSRFMSITRVSSLERRGPKTHHCNHANQNKPFFHLLFSFSVVCFSGKPGHS
jgi:hypothetical protein